MLNINSPTYTVTRIPGRPAYHIPTNRRAAIKRFVVAHERIRARTVVASK